MDRPTKACPPPPGPAPADAWRDEATGEHWPDLAAALVDVAARLRSLAPNETAVIRLCITRVPAKEARAS